MQEKYEKYANLLLTKCLNITTEKSLIINAPIESIEFVRILAKQAYQLGIEDIYFDFEDEELKHDQLKQLSKDALAKSRFWNKVIYDEYAKQNAAVLMLIAGDDDLMEDVEAEKLEYTGSIYRTSRPLYKEKQAKYQIPWCIASVATERWSKKVFPNDINSKEKLWGAIYKCCLINTENPTEAWEQKIIQSEKRASLLNKYKFKRLHYQNQLGTDLEIELPKQHIWYSAGKSIEGRKSGIVNMPTEEVFTSPVRTGVNGIVHSSKPLVYNGGLINHFSLQFKDGKVIHVEAETGQELLEKIIDSCQNADMLGEVALVEHDSPISNSQILFYNTLFDENASCHLALGAGFPNCLENGEKMTSEQLLENGMNQSDTHVDFMIGTQDLSVKGITENNEVISILENGKFVLK